VYAIDDIGALDELRAIGESGRFLFFATLTDELSLVRGDISADMGWLNIIGEILVRKTGERIAAMLTDAGRSDEPDREVSERALLELYMICKEARR
jgi:hypothetical protein